MSAELRWLTQHPNARCNDGTPSGYYFRPGSSNDWLVVLDSGGWCWDELSCAMRCDHEPARCTSDGWPSSRRFAGIMRSNRPRLAAANRIFVPYCTSDAFVANTSAFGRQFRGLAVVAAVLEEMVQTHGFGASTAKHTLIFGGKSAGGRGAMVLLDSIREMLPLAPAVRAAVEVRGLLDSPLWLDIEPLHAGTGPRFAGFRSFADATLSFHAHLIGPGASHESASSHCTASPPWRCYFGEYRLPLLRTPYMLIASQFDTFQLDYNFGCSSWACSSPARASGEQAAYALRFANRTASLLRALAVGPRLVFSNRCHQHAVLLDDNDFAATGCLGISIEQAVLDFVSLPPLAPSHHPGLPRQIIDETPDDRFDHCACESDVARQLGAAVALAALAAAFCLRSRRRHGPWAAWRWVWRRLRRSNKAALPSGIRPAAMQRG